MMIVLFFVLSHFAIQAKEENAREDVVRDSTLSTYFHSDIMIQDSYLGGTHKFDVLTEKGLYVVQMNEDYTKVLKALPKPKD